nr:hypothetical protein [Tanacetum cinerariifolium]
MSILKFADVHKLVAFLSKPTESEGFDKIIDFLNANPIKYELTINPTVYTSCIEQFWATAKEKTINGEAQIHAMVDGKKLIISEASIRRDLKFKDEGGVDCLSKEVIFEQLTLIGSTMASIIICLATNQKFNFSKYILESMVKHLDSGNKILMYLRFVQVFLDKQVDRMSKHNAIYVIPSHTKKVFGNVKRVGKYFSREETPLFPTMLVQAQKEMGEENVTNEAANEEIDDSLERAATIATSLDAEENRGNINKTQSKATPNEPSSYRTSSGGGPKRQDTTGDIIAQTRSENVSKFSNNPLLVRVNTPRSGEDSMKLNELMEIFTTSHNRVLKLETTKTIQALEIESLKRRVKKLKKKQRSRTHKIKRLYKVSLSARVESSDDDQSLGKEDASKQGRIADINADEGITLGTTTTTVVTSVTPASTRPMAKGLVIHEEEKADTSTVSSQQPSQIKVRDKGKGMMIEPEPVKKLSKKDQISLDEELAFKLQAEEKEEERLAREKAHRIKEVNIAWDDNSWRKEGNSLQLKELKKRGINHQQKLNKGVLSMKRINTFVDFITELVEESSKKAQAELTQEGRSKRAGDELEQKRSKKQKVKDDKESEELKKCMEIIPNDGDDVTIDVTPLSFKSPITVDYKIHKEGKM